jgi:ABC-type dipeptide/oligopeptide/nickel transport system permease subunit
MAGVLLVVSAFEMAAMILYEAGVGFLGLSVPPTIPSWGNMLADGRNYLTTSWWIATFPGLGIMATVLGMNLVGDGLRDVLDPRLRTNSDSDHDRTNRFRLTREAAEDPKCPDTV